MGKTMIIDQFGTWENLGSISPVADDWQTFPLFANHPTGTLKLYFNGNSELLRDWKISGWIRAMYFSGSKYFFDQRWLRIYPKDEPEILHYPYPPDLIKDPLPSRQFQVKRRIYWRKEFKDNAPDFGVQLVVKTDSQVIYPGDPYPAIIEEEQQTTQ